MSRTTGVVLAGVAVAALYVGLVWQPWVAVADPGRDQFASGRPADSPANSPGEGTPMARDQFGQDRGGPSVADAKPIPFDGDRAITYLKELCAIGPRVSGSPGMKKQQHLVGAHFEKHGATVTRQEFQARQNSQREPVGMVNLIAAWQPERKRRIILCAHYDTRPMADQEANRLDWGKPFLSANDGTSGVAFLMELAHEMDALTKLLPADMGIDFVLFDGEEYIFETGGTLRGADRYFLGSEHFAAEYARNRADLPYRYEAAILFDLFAHENARLAVEGYSYQWAPDMVNGLWGTAEAVGAKSFHYKRGFQRAVDVLDDHIALNQAGIPAVDIIDFDYDHWHKLSDTPDKCSGKQMTEVAKVVTTWLQLLK